MKHYGGAFLLALGLAGALTLGAAAADYEAAAQELAQIGIFRGSAQGFELDRAPTRTEAAVMLVRLLGGEKEAAAQFAAGAIPQPFGDVPPWAEPYVAWLSAKGLVQGMAAADGTLRFGGEELCTAQMYVTFLLRALDYRDSGAVTDFRFDGALELAQELGIYDAAQLQGSFLRDDLAALTLQALTVDPRQDTDSLLERLLARGAISHTAAGELRETVRRYRAWRDDTARQAEQTDWDMTLTLTTRLGESESETDMHLCTQRQEDGSMGGASTTRLATSLGFEATLSHWWKDGWQYTQAGTQRTKTRGSSAAAVQDWSVEPLYLCKSIECVSDHSGTQYTVELLPIAARVTASLGVAAVTVSSPITLEAQFGQDGVIQSSQLRFTQTVSGGAAAVELSCAYASGSVSIDWPDFTEFTLE